MPSQAGLRSRRRWTLPRGITDSARGHMWRFRFKIRTIMIAIAAIAVLIVSVRIALHNPVVVGVLLGLLGISDTTRWRQRSRTTGWTWTCRCARMLGAMTSPHGVRRGHHANANAFDHNRAARDRRSARVARGCRRAGRDLRPG